MASSVYVPTSSGGGGASATIGAAVPSTASPTAVKDSSGNLTYPALDASGNLLIAGTLSTTPPAAATSTQSNVSALATSQTVLAANSARLGFSMYNDSTVACNVRRNSAAASTTNFFKRLLPGEFISTATLGFNYTGAFTCIWDSATGTMRVAEDTA